MLHPTPHEHALGQAEALCQRHGVRLTPLRRRVLELISSSAVAIKAYELMERLSTGGRMVKPPTVYRALDFLLEQGLIHRVDSLNAYVGCTHPQEPHDVRLLICTQCGQVAELADPMLDSSLALALAKTGFKPSRAHLEIHGLCARCQQKT